MPKRKLPANFQDQTQSKKLLKWAKEFPRKSFFVPRKITEDKFFSSYGPRNGILFVGDSNEDNITEEKGVLTKLSSIFNEGINDKNCSLGISDFIPYFKSKYNEDLIIGNVTKEDSLNMTSDYAFSYLIDTCKNNKITSFPVIPSNTKNSKFFKGADFERGDSNKSFFILPSSLVPHHIVGAFANDALAYSLSISQDTLIINPNYAGERLEEIKNKLNINNTKEFSECHTTYSDYDTAAKAFYYSKNNHYIR